MLKAVNPRMELFALIVKNCQYLSVSAAAPQNSGFTQLVKKDFGKPVDGEASSPATATLTIFC